MAPRDGKASPRWRRRALVGAAVLLVAAGAVVARSFAPLDRAGAERTIDHALAELVTSGDVHGVVALVDAPRHGIERRFAHGLADVDRGVPMTAQTPFFSASVGKMFVATAVMALVAEGRISLEAPVTRYVPAAAIAGLPVRGGDAALERITVRMLLAHRSGLPDYFSDPSRDGAPRLFDRLVTEPTRTWTRAQLFDYARAHYAPVGAPGERFHYSDTNYDLLGMVLEGVADQPFHRVVRERVLDPLRLTHTWYHAFESPPPGLVATADVWVSGVNLRGIPALSADQAGGGLVTTVEDLRVFLRALVSGRPVPLSVFDADVTRDAMHPGIDVGRCLWRIRPGGVFFALAGMPELVGHSGATGVFVYYAPDWDAVFVGAVSDSGWQERHLEFLLSEMVPVLARVPIRRGAAAVPDRRPIR